MADHSKDSNSKKRLFGFRKHTKKKDCILFYMSEKQILSSEAKGNGTGDTSSEECQDQTESEEPSDSEMYDEASGLSLRGSVLLRVLSGALCFIMGFCSWLLGC